MKVQVVSILFICCVKFSFAQKINTIRIDPDNANGGTVSQVFKSVTYIPLETTKESLFGKIYQLEITDDHFIILDQETRSILFFKRNGNFEFKIKPKSPDQFFGHFTIDRKKELLIIHTDINALSIYNLKGEFLHRVELPFQFYTIFHFNNNVFLYHVHRPATPAKHDTIQYDLYYSNSYKDLTKKVVPYNAKYEITEYNIYTNTINHICGEDVVTFSIPYNYNVYELNDTGIIQHYKFLFPEKYSLPNDFATNRIYTGKKNSYIRNAGLYTKIASIENVYHLNENLLFTMRVAVDARNYIYNLKTGNLISFDRVSGDSSSYFIPVMAFGEDLAGVYKNHIFSSAPAYYLFNINKKKPTKYNIILDNFFKNSNAHANPIIIEAELKNDL